MPAIWTQALKDSISEVFSTMFFVVPVEMPELAEEVRQESAADWYTGSLEATKDGERVRFWVWSPPGPAREMAANILSLEPGEVRPEDVLDAYAEMVNMVVGSVLTAVDTESQWVMGLPAAQRLHRGLLGQVLSQAEELLFLDVEDQPVVAGWRAWPK